jgi:hypothetical protein
VQRINLQADKNSDPSAVSYAHHTDNVPFVQAIVVVNLKLASPLSIKTDKLLISIN